ncbi:hypothetical protein [Acinetobacter junii]|uniref:hypothetical protein n=1 Tax=Acinetobacter junii TaxID=40215 RepID=UPI00124CBF33|nr:hypothetical protein [Acinetobacter junii]
MDQIEVEGTLPVALKKMVGQTVVISKEIVMRQPSAIEYLQAQASISSGDFIAIADLAAMTKLVDDKGNEHDITYDMLGHSSRSNLDYLINKRAELDAKEAAESSSNEQKLSGN